MNKRLPGRAIASVRDTDRLTQSPVCPRSAHDADVSQFRGFGDGAVRQRVAGVDCCIVSGFDRETWIAVCLRAIIFFRSEQR